jgi:GntR family transcriptional regulator / MocR family aminotransferase
MHIASLYRYPVKGLSPENLTSVQVVAGEGFPLDRMYALLRSSAEFDPNSPAWLAKANFIMLMLHEQIATLKTRYLHQDQSLHIKTPDGRERAFMLGENAGREALAQFFLAFMPKQLNDTPRLVVAPGHQFTDKAEKFISLINLASLRELEQRWGQTLDPLRFRANVYIDGAPPFSEFDWVGQDIQLGDISAQVVKRNGRCAATNVNPDTGERDRNVPGLLRTDFGHKDLGVYLTLRQNGELHEGDPVTSDHFTETDRVAPANVDKPDGQLMCSACYYLFEPHILNPAWRQAQDLPAHWRCPDCGATREQVVIQT